MRKKIEGDARDSREAARGDAGAGRPLEDLESVVDRMRQLDAIDACAYADQPAKAAAGS
jgi:hypothetical protein